MDAATLTSSLRAALGEFNNFQAPKFTGKQNAEEWILSFEAATRNLDGPAKVGSLPCFFTGSALSWYAQRLSSSEAPTDWDGWKAAIKAHFLAPKASLIMEAQNKKFNVEKVDPLEYCQDIIGLCSRINPNMSKEEMLMYLMTGLPDGMRRDMNIMSPTDPENFKIKLQTLVGMANQGIQNPDPQQKIIESLITVIKEQKEAQNQQTQRAPPTQQYAPIAQPSYAAFSAQAQPQITPALYTNNSEMQEMKDMIRNLQQKINGMGVSRPQTQNQAQNNRPNYQNANNRNGSGTRKNGDCYYCGKPGHYKYECRKRQQDFERQSDPRGPRPQTPGNGAERQ